MDRSYLPCGLVADGSNGAIADRTSGHHATCNARLGPGSRTVDHTSFRTGGDSCCYTGTGCGRADLYPAGSVFKDLSANREQTFGAGERRLGCSAGCAAAGTVCACDSIRFRTSSTVSGGGQGTSFIDH